MPTAQHTLSTMDPVSLAEMDAHALMNRVDTKYILGADLLQELLENMGRFYRVLSVATIRLSQYRTLYFDTQNHECYLQHHNGKLNRRKYRIRKYLSTDACFLEVKSKNNKGRTKKKRISIDDFEDSLSPSSLDFIKSVTGTLPELDSAIWSSFSRITLVNRLQPERVTLDLDLEFSDGKSQKDLPHILIAEVKQERDNRHTPIREYLRRQHVRPMRVSKYCLGTMLLKPHLKSNRFKRKLLAIRKIA